MVEKYDDGGPQHFQCMPQCGGVREWHRCRQFACFVPGCRNSGVAKPSPEGEKPTLPWGDTFWCKECGGYVEYNPESDILYEGPWK